LVILDILANLLNILYFRMKKLKLILFFVLAPLIGTIYFIAYFVGPWWEKLLD